MAVFYVVLKQLGLGISVETTVEDISTTAMLSAIVEQMRHVSDQAIMTFSLFGGCKDKINAVYSIVVVDMKRIDLNIFIIISKDIDAYIFKALNRCDFSNGCG